MKEGPYAWAPVTHMGDVNEVPGSGLLYGPELAVIATRGINQRMEDFSQFLKLPPFFVCQSAFQINKYWKKQIR